MSMTWGIMTLDERAHARALDIYIICIVSYMNIIMIIGCNCDKACNV